MSRLEHPQCVAASMNTEADADIDADIRLYNVKNKQLNDSSRRALFEQT